MNPVPNPFGVLVLLLAKESHSFRKNVGFSVQSEECIESPSLCAVESRQICSCGQPDTGHRAEDSGSEFECASTYRSTISPFSFSILADWVYGFRRATVRLEVVGFSPAHKFKDSNGFVWVM